ncbi:MAG: hypothetical protein V4724_28875 [Pseudomonadota bacterium]
MSLLQQTPCQTNGSAGMRLCSTGFVFKKNPAKSRLSIEKITSKNGEISALEQKAAQNLFHIFMK